MSTETDPNKARIEQLEREKADLAAKFGAQDSRISEIAGQISLLVNAATNQPQPPVDPGNIVDNPQAVLDHFWQERAGPIVAEQVRQAAETNKQLLALQRPEDWKTYGPKVEQMIREKKITPDTLRNPGSFEALLNLVKSEHVDEIVKQKVEAEVAAFQAKSAMAATGGQPAAPTPEVTDVKFDVKQNDILAKLGVDPKRAAEVSKDTTTDGFRISGSIH